jgi:hypothetical protein
MKPVPFYGPKGEELRFIKGKYDGLKGWVSADLGYTEKEVYVIVEKTASRTFEILTRVPQKSIERAVLYNKEPKSYGEAMLQQHKDIETMMNKIVEKMVECHIDSESCQEIQSILKGKIRKAQIKQQALGSKALWRKVVYNPEAGEI